MPIFLMKFLPYKKHLLIGAVVLLVFIISYAKYKSFVADIKQAERDRISLNLQIDINKKLMGDVDELMRKHEELRNINTNIKKRYNVRDADINKLIGSIERIKRKQSSVKSSTDNKNENPTNKVISDNIDSDINQLNIDIKSQWLRSIQEVRCSSGDRDSCIN